MSTRPALAPAARADAPRGTSRPGTGSPARAASGGGTSGGGASAAGTSSAGTSGGGTSGAGTSGAGTSVAAQISSSGARVRAALDALHQALATVDAFDPQMLARPALAELVVGMQRFADRYTTSHARFIGAADRATVWASSGSRNITGWLADQTNGSYGHAVQMVKLADAIEASPQLAQHLQAGTISTATAATLHDAIVNPPRAADRDAVEQLVQQCAGTAPRDARHTVEQWKAEHRTETDDELAARRHARRSVRFGHPVDGMATTTAVLSTDHTDALRKVLLSLAGPLSDDNPRTTEQAYADGLINLVGVAARVQPDTGSSRSSATLLVTIDAESLAGTANRPGITEFGNPIPAHIVRNMADHALLHRVVMAGNVVINVGKGVRLATDAQFKALLARDGGCRVRGCDMPAAWCEIDHIRRWADGGTTDLGNLWLLCPHHHALKDRHDVQVIGSGHDLSLLLPNGTTIDCRPDAGRRRRTSAAA